ncbi:MAG: dienelactone hydrolase family protein [Candidatus Hydrogenedentes bacterium]|nr:dienelactone hydrolase family protein [Candidatus Hydrogenedentota bacterium]
MVDLATMKSLTEWPKARKAIIQAVKQVFGALPKDHVELQVKVVDETSGPSYVRQRINYFVDEWERVSAWLFIPEGKDEVPGILCCHRRVPQGKEEAAGIEGDPRLAFAHHYASLGYATIAPDSVAAGERAPHGLDPFDTSHLYRDNPKMSALGKMLVDNVHALDALCETKRVDVERLGVVGHGLGGTAALILASLDERIQACVASCGFTRFADDSRPQRWVDDDGFSALPKLKEAVEGNSFPFDWEHLLALAAPNPTLLITALNDEVLAKTRSCGKAVKLAQTVYALLGEAEALQNHEHHDGHSMTEECLARADEWFERWL